MDSEVLGRILADLAPLSRRFDDAGHRLYLVGGVVRDLVRGAAPDAADDIDLTTDADPATTRALVAPLASALWTQGERFGTIGARVAGRAIEITTHRAETYVVSSRKPEVVFGTDVVVDLSRRDFTINAMALELPDGSLIDPYGGARDLADRRLRTPIDPLVSFSDDPLRMLRAARFIARFGLDPVPELVAVATSSAPRLKIVSVERIHDELERLLATTDPVPGIRFLVTTGLLAQVLPSAVEAGARTDARFGGRSCLDVALAVLPRLSSVAARRALLLWPVVVDEGVAGVEAITRRLRYSTADQHEARRLTAALGDVLTGPGDAAPVVRRLTGELGGSAPALWTLLAPLAAESTDESLRAWLEVLSRTSRELEERGELGRLDPPLDGRAVMRHLGCRPGPVIGEALDVLRRTIVDRGPVDEVEARAILDRWWAERSA